MVLNQVNLPVEGIALIIGIDRILDMSRTAVNISGDAICAMIVAKSEEKYNTDQSADLKKKRSEMIHSFLIYFLFRTIFFSFIIVTSFKFCTKLLLNCPDFGEP